MTKVSIIAMYITLVFALCAWAGGEILDLKEKVTMLSTSKDYVKEDLTYIKNKLNQLDDKISKLRR